jgi:hypothetical protein
MDGLRRGLTVEETANRILRQCPEVLPLQAWRLAHGWTRAEVSARPDRLGFGTDHGPDDPDHLRANGIIDAYPFTCQDSEQNLLTRIDDVCQAMLCRVMLYGHGKRGTQGPIITYAASTSAHTYFVDQIRWLEPLTTEPDLEPWASKGIRVRPLTL